MIEDLDRRCRNGGRPAKPVPSVTERCDGTITSIERGRRCVAIRAAGLCDVALVAARMREVDRQEIRALRGDGANAADVAMDAVYGRRSVAFCAWSGDEPVAAFGAAEVRPTLWSVWLFATEGWPTVALAATRFVRRELLPGLLAAGANRAECRSIVDHTQAHRWLERLGAKHEADLIDCGPERRTFRLYAWRRGDFEDRTTGA